MWFLFLFDYFLSCLTGYAGSVNCAFESLAVGELSFSPVKLLFLIGWVYLCLYMVQRIQFSPLIPRQYIPWASVATLITGPFFLAGALITHAIKKSAQEPNSTVFEIVRDHISQALNRICSAKILKGTSQSQVALMDSSGKSIYEVYGRGKKSADNAILDLTKQIIFDALEDDASDILIDPKNNTEYSVRFRVDGVLRTVETIKSSSCEAVINSIKAVSNMDIAEKRRPQDGAFFAKTSQMDASFRVASAGVVNGEKLSIRVLNQNAGRFTLDNVGLTHKQSSLLRKVIKKPQGMILMCGPTGSGKTTTLYAMLNEIDLFTRNVITVEDPIEYVMPNASQIEVNPKANINFGNSLRSILRQDPDVICVGEIRDEETATIALRAAQTGHLVLATIHSRSNEAALVRLIDLGVSLNLLASGLEMLVSQRLLRKLCDNCKAPAQLSQNRIDQLRKRKINYSNIYTHKGCKMCYQTGYRNRIAIFDFLSLDNELKNIITTNPSFVDETRKRGSKKGRSNMTKQGLRKVVTGVTSFEELKRVVG